MRFAVVTLATLVLTACGSHAPRSPESVARAWSAALDRNDNEAAGKLFAAGAEIVQNGALVLRSHRDAVEWNALLPCGGRITSVTANGRDQVLVIFRLTERPRHRCDAPGAKAAALFRVEDGEIVLWHQTNVPEEAPTTTAQTV